MDDDKKEEKISVKEFSSGSVIREVKVKGNSMKKTKKNMTLSVLVIILLGISSGFFLSRNITSKDVISNPESAEDIDKGKAFGSADSKTFKDSAEGLIEQGGVDGEGTHRLVREGGESQTVFLTSSVLDLKQFEGKKVKIWGETFAAQTAGWLMDVGKVEIID